MLPKPNALPVNYSSPKKMLNNLRLGYRKINAYKNNCVLFFGEFEKLDNCPKYNEGRYQKNKISNKVFR